jgi:hypothetical protein
MVALWLWPILLMLYVIASRIWFSSVLPQDPHRMSDMSFVLLGFLLADIFMVHIEVLDSFRHQNCFPFIDPFNFFFIVARFIKSTIKYVVKKILAPFKRASYGMAHYIKIGLGFVRKYGTIVWDKISTAVTNIALAIYNVIKTTLVTLWKAVVVAFV